MSDGSLAQQEADSPRLSGVLTGASPQPIVIVQPAGRQTVWWVLTVVLAVLATAILARQDKSLLPGALAQTFGANQSAGARGIYAFTGQLTARSYGLFMMDVDSGTIWCYELQHGPSGEPQMKLVAARSWLYDRFLEEFNVADPVPSVVKTLVQQQRNAGSGAMASPVPSGTGDPPLPTPAGRK